VTRQELENIQFEWDERKATSNLAKHGVSFADAGLVFFDEHALFEPNDNSSGEGRFQVIGLAAGLLLLFFVYTDRDNHGQETIRIISARKATANERRRYFEAR
jgi:uncharacterized DUF497 family protein